MTRKMQTSQIEAFDELEAAAEDTAPPCAPSDAVDYIRDMVGTLRDMAEEADQMLLAYLLDMAHEEARLQSRRMARQQNQAIGRA